MWDLAAYRVLDKPHHRTGTQWKIYPSYDFTRMSPHFQQIKPAVTDS
jgi:glutamyl/glutaminyl-tRNA synthetase